MPSFDVVNYSLRPSKCIQRQLVFDGVRQLQPFLDLDRLAYIGFGSIWFTDFVLAHKHLGVNDMVSIERDIVGYKRATFNCPYATVRVLHGESSVVLPTLYDDQTMSKRPWLAWLDCDGEFNETLKDDVRSVLENAPMNSILIITFNGYESAYGQAPDRPLRLRELFGEAVPDNLPKKACKNERMQETLADLAIDFMKSVVAESARPGGFVPAFRIVYRDNAPMVTVGGILPAKGAMRTAADVVGGDGWRCLPSKPIMAPHLTIREAAVLQSKLPSARALSRDDVKELGFDLDERQVEAFESYYRQYPTFAQIVA